MTEPLGTRGSQGIRQTETTGKFTNNGHVKGKDEYEPYDYRPRQRINSETGWGRDFGPGDQR